MRLDFTNVEEPNFDPLPSGWYNVMVTQASEAETGENSKNPGTPMIKVQYTVEDSEDYNNRKLFDNFVIPQNPDDKNFSLSMGTLKKFLRSNGVEVDDGDIDFEPDDLVGNQLSVKVTIQKARKDNQGIERPESNNVRDYRMLGEEESVLP